MRMRQSKLRRMIRQVLLEAGRKPRRRRSSRRKLKAPASAEDLAYAIFQQFPPDTVQDEDGMYDVVKAWVIETYGQQVFEDMLEDALGVLESEFNFQEGY